MMIDFTADKEKFVFEVRLAIVIDWYKYKQ